MEDTAYPVWAPALAAVRCALQAAPGAVTVAIDGRCASGKTTFAAFLAREWSGQSALFHLDDYFLPPARRTPQRLSQPGGNVDYERFLDEVLLPLSRGEAANLRPFDCKSGTFGPPRQVPPARLNILEGSYSLHPALAGYVQLPLFFTCSPQTQLSRLARRETPESLERFRSRWIPMEEAYFSAFHIPERCSVIVDTSD